MGAAILTIDWWFQNGLPIPQLLANANNLKAVLGAAFLVFVFWVLWVALRPPVFSKGNAKRFFEVNRHFIHEGNADRIQIVAEELGRSLPAIIAIAAKIPFQRGGSVRKVPGEVLCARYLLLLFVDRRFCKIIVDKIPAFALYLCEEAKNCRTTPTLRFARNIGQEFIRDTNSSLYQEQSKYDSGFLVLSDP